MWPDTSLCDLLGVEHPIIQAPMAGASTPALAAAAANAGAVGSLGLAMHDEAAMRAEVAELRARTNGAINLNFFVHAPPRVDPERFAAARALVAPLYAERGIGEPPERGAGAPPFGEAQLRVLLDLRPRIASFHFGLPAPEAVRAIKEAGIVVLSTATTPEEARALERGGADAVIAQGWEAGGHRGVFDPEAGAGEIGTMALVPQVADAVSAPVIAAGGIADGRGIAAAFMLGAAGVQIGTAFLTTEEARCAPAHRAALMASDGAATRVTRAFSGRPARSVANRLVRHAQGRDHDLPDFPMMRDFVAPLAAASMEAGDGDFLPLWSGQAVGLNRALPAAELMDRLIGETRAALGR